MGNIGKRRGRVEVLQSQKEPVAAPKRAPEKW